MGGMKGRRKSRLLYADLSYSVMAAVFEVHNVLGPGFAEAVYEEALARELRQRDIPFERQKLVQVEYKGEPIGTHRLDLVVDGKIILAKAAMDSSNVFRAQLLSYLRATGLRLGILVNFGGPKVRYERIVN